MSPYAPALLSAGVIALLVGCASTPASPTAPAPTVSRSDNSVLPSGPEAALEKGMTADTVKRIMGAPAEIRPMPSSTDRAEIWVYRRTTQGSVRQVQVGSKTIPLSTVVDSNGAVRVLQSIEEPIFSQQFEIFDETVSLLMYDRQYVERKRTVQKRLEYQ